MRLHVAAALAAALLLAASCRTARETERVAVRTDTVRVALRSADTVRLSDTLRLVERTAGDTVFVTRDAVRWRERVSVRTDTVWRSRTDTVSVRTVVEARLSLWQRARLATWPLLPLLLAALGAWAAWKRIKG